MPDGSDSFGGSWGAVAAVVAVVACCGLPLLLAGGIAVGAVGIATGSIVAVAVGAALAVWGWRRHQRRHCDVATNFTIKPGRPGGDGGSP